MNVGVLGGGQLGRMLALAGYPLGLRFRFFEPREGAPVQGVGMVVKAPWEDADAVRAFGREVDLVTLEFENVPVDVARALASDVPVLPPPGALQVAQDRLAEKEVFRKLDIPAAAWQPVAERGDLESAVGSVGLPAVLKTRRMGYDGKGQFVLRRPDDVEEAWQALGGQPLLLERLVPFRRELSCLGVRARDGRTLFYPLVENEHREGILYLSVAPAPLVTPQLQAMAEGYVSRLMDALDYVGVLALELFQEGDQLLANEMAPRVHNSGHWTQDGAETSQFENHLRAVCGYPLGSPAVRRHAAMVNILGRVPRIERLLVLDGVHVHLYGKAPRPRRKLGHVNVTGDSPGELRARLEAVERVLAADRG